MREVVHLDYEAYEGMAEKTMTELADALKAKHGLIEVAIHHRVGRVGIGDTSACKEAIDTLKVSVPLWMKETYAGGEEWIGQGS